MVGLVILLVVILVIVKVTSSSSTSGPQAPSKPVTAAIAAQVTQIPESVYNAVGVSSPNVPVAPPRKISGQKPLTIDGKPGVFYMGGEFCPYCAAERWSLIAALSRFGKLTGLHTMESSSTDVYPNTQTFTFYKATFTSPYIGTQLVEFYSNQPTSTGQQHKILTPLTKAQETLVTTYDNVQVHRGLVDIERVDPLHRLRQQVPRLGRQLPPDSPAVAHPGTDRRRAFGRLQLGDPGHRGVGQLPVGRHLLDRRLQAVERLQRQGRAGRGQDNGHQSLRP